MTTYTVTNTIQSQNLDDNRPVEVAWYKGDNLALAVSAMTQAATHNLNDSHLSVPQHMRYKVLSVNMTITEEN